MKRFLLNTPTRLFAADAGAATGEAPQTATGTTTEPAKFEYNEAREFFMPDESAKAEARVNEIASNLPNITVLSFDGEWPEGAGVCILPLSRNEKVKDAQGQEQSMRKLHAIQVWPWHTLASIRNSAGGEAYIEQVIRAEQAASILNPMRRQRWEKGEFDVSSCPVSLQDHIEGMRQDKGVIAPYMEACKVLLPQLKEKSKIFAAFTPQYLRTLLQSKPMAMQFNAKLEEKGFFVELINTLKQITTLQKGNTEIYDRWIATRDAEQEVSVDDLDLDDLDLNKLVAADNKAA